MNLTSGLQSRTPFNDHLSVCQITYVVSVKNPCGGRNGIEVCEGK